MISPTYLIIVGIFLLYYLLVLIIERKMISEPKEIISKFLAVILLYAGISIIYFSFTGKPFLSESTENYNLYIFIIGFVSILWTIPDLLSEFNFFNKFMNVHIFCLVSIIQCNLYLYNYSTIEKCVKVMYASITYWTFQESKLNYLK